MGRKYPPSSDSWVWESVTPQIASVDSRLQQILYLFVLKSGGTVPLSPKSGGTGTPRTSVNYAYDKRIQTVVYLYGRLIYLVITRVGDAGEQSVRDARNELGATSSTLVEEV